MPLTFYHILDVYFFLRANPNENGIQFKGEIETYTVEVNVKKKSVSITWKANPKGDFLKFFMKVNANGYTTVNVTSTNIQAITYNGSLKAKEQKQSENYSCLPG